MNEHSKALDRFQKDLIAAGFEPERYLNVVAPSASDPEPRCGMMLVFGRYIVGLCPSPLVLGYEDVYQRCRACRAKSEAEGTIRHLHDLTFGDAKDDQKGLFGRIKERIRGSLAGRTSDFESDSPSSTLGP